MVQNIQQHPDWLQKELEEEKRELDEITKVSLLFQALNF
jgi:hypothetical protein